MEIFLPEDDSDITQEGPVLPAIPLDEQGEVMRNNNRIHRGILDAAQDKGNLVMLTHDGYIIMPDTA
jgi:hypothetical protein